MNTSIVLPEIEAAESLLLRGRVVVIEKGFDVLVSTDAKEKNITECDVLLGSDGSGPYLSVGDEVLIWRPAEATKRAVIIGRIGPSHQSPAGTEKASEDVADELVIEAKKNLTLRCGEGSITIREDGKILIKGKDLVSHAQRMNRIKGGSVSIN